MMHQMALHGGDIYNQSIQYDFSVNINPLGMEFSLRQAMEKAVQHCNTYPQYGNIRLREAIGESVGLMGEKVLCGNGASELLAAIVHALRPAKVVIPQPAFSGYAWAAQMVDAQIRNYMLQEETNFAITEEILEVLSEDVDLLFLASPSNPVGSMIAQKLLRKILVKCKVLGIVVVLDECFIEFTGKESVCKLVNQFDNLIVIRAFTKIYAIPGVRLGYLLASHPLCDQISRQLPEWNLSVIAQQAGCFVLAPSSKQWDREHYLEHTIEIIKEERQFLTEELIKDSGGKIRVYPSESNFLLLKTELPLYEELLKMGILVRDCSNYEGLDRGYYRIAVREHTANQMLLHAIGSIVKGDRL